MTRCKRLILLLLCFIPYTGLSSQLIEFSGSEFVVTTKNLLQMTPTSAANIWEDKQTFSKLRILEIDTAPEKYRSMIRNQVNNSPNAIFLTQYDKFTSNKQVIVVRELIAQTPFLRFIFVAGTGSKSFHVELSFPESADTEQLIHFQEMLELLDWQVNYEVTLQAEASVSVSRIPGFAISKKFDNALLLRSAKFLAPLKDAMVSISLADIEQTQNQQEATLHIIHSAKSLSDVRISAIEKADTPQGQRIIVTSVANMTPDGTEVDMITISQQVQNSLLLVQVATVSYTESLLKMEDVSLQILGHIRVVN